MGRHLFALEDFFFKFCLSLARAKDYSTPFGAADIVLNALRSITTSRDFQIPSPRAKEASLMLVEWCEWCNQKLFVITETHLKERARDLQ